MNEGCYYKELYEHEKQERAKLLGYLLNKNTIPISKTTCANLLDESGNVIMTYYPLTN